MKKEVSRLAKFVLPKEFYSRIKSMILKERLFEGELIEHAGYKRTKALCFCGTSLLIKLHTQGYTVVCPFCKYTFSAEGVRSIHTKTPPKKMLEEKMLEAIDKDLLRLRRKELI